MGAFCVLIIIRCVEINPQSAHAFICFSLICDVVIYYVYRYSIDHNNWLLAEYTIFFGIFLWSFTPEFATAFNFTPTQLNHVLTVIMYLIGTCFVH